MCLTLPEGSFSAVWVLHRHARHFCSLQSCCSILGDSYCDEYLRKPPLFLMCLTQAIISTFYMINAGLNASAEVFTAVFLLLFSIKLINSFIEKLLCSSAAVLRWLTSVGWFYGFSFVPSMWFVLVGLLPPLVLPHPSPVAAAVGQRQVWVGLRFSSSLTLTHPNADK